MFLGAVAERVLCAKVELAAHTEQFPAVSAIVAADGGETCPAPPKAASTARAPSPATDGPTFFRLRSSSCTSPQIEVNSAYILFCKEVDNL